MPYDGRDDARPRGNRVSPAKRQPERSLHSNVGNEPRLPGGADAQGVRSDHRPATPSTVPGELPRILAHESIGSTSPEGCLVRASCKAICRLFGQSAALPQPIRQVGHPRPVEGRSNKVAFNGTHRGGDQWPAGQSERYVVGRSRHACFDHRPRRPSLPQGTGRRSRGRGCVPQRDCRLLVGRNDERDRGFPDSTLISSRKPGRSCQLEAIDRPRRVSHQQGAYSRKSEG